MEMILPRDDHTCYSKIIPTSSLITLNDKLEYGYLDSKNLPHANYNL